MLIPCPHCGHRDVSEFTYLGDAKSIRPEPAKAKQTAWVDFVYYRDNPLGPHKELWQHNGGCRLVVELVRDTKTHEITAAAGRGPHMEGKRS